MGERDRTFREAGGTCGRLIAERDWAASSVGPIATWPSALFALVADMLHTRQPMLLFWGPDLVQFYNDAFVPSFGQGKHPTAMGQPARECWTDAWPVIGAQIDAVMSAGEPAWHEDALVPIHRNGRMEEVFWTYSYSPAFDDDGVVHGTLVIVTEMTGRVLFARRLEALASLSMVLWNAETHDDVLAKLGDVVARWPSDVPFVIIRDAHDRVRAFGVAANPAERVAAAIPPAREQRESVVREPIIGAVWPEPISRVLACPVGYRQEVIFGLSPRLPFDDAYRSFLTQIAGQIDLGLRHIDDANETLAVQRQRDNLLMQAPVATALMTGPDHVYRLANPLYCKLVGRDPTGKAYIEAFPELRDSPLPGILARVYATGEPFVATEQCVQLDRTGSGQVEDCYVNFNLEPMRREDGTVYGMMAVAVDITELVRARLAVERSDAERGRMLLASQEAARMKDEFLAMLGHELRNPLAPIVTALDMLKLKHASGEQERTVIERQVRHVIRLVDDLLDISKITRGVVELDREVVDLRDIIAVAVESTRHLTEQKRHQLTIEADEPVFVDGDETRLAQVVLNVLTNAARYTPDGGRIQVRLLADPAEARIEVEDTGVGIAAELLPRVFDTFVQGTRNTDRAEGGLGLGLAIARNLIALHGGTITAHSEGPGTGSVFTIRLARVAREVREAAAPRATTATQARRILVVDDNEDAAELLGEVARLRGHDVTVVHDPERALAIVEALAPEIAVLDIGLPGMDGYELASRVRALCPACHLVALTGYGQESDRIRTREAGFAHHLVKPVRVEQLLEVIGQLAADRG